MSDIRWRTWLPFQRAADPIFVLNRFGRVVFVNRAWEQLTGIPLAEARPNRGRNSSAKPFGRPTR